MLTAAPLPLPHLARAIDDDVSCSEHKRTDSARLSSAQADPTELDITIAHLRTARRLLADRSDAAP